MLHAITNELIRNANLSLALEFPLGIARLPHNFRLIALVTKLVTFITRIGTIGFVIAN